MSTSAISTGCFESESAGLQRQQSANSGLRRSLHKNGFFCDEVSDTRNTALREEPSYEGSLTASSIGLG